MHWVFLLHSPLLHVINSFFPRFFLVFLFVSSPCSSFSLLHIIHAHPISTSPANFATVDGGREGTGRGSDEICPKLWLWQHEKKSQWSGAGGPVYGQKASGWFSLVPLLERGEQALVTHSGRAVYNPWLHPTFISLFLLSQFLQCFIQTSHLSLPFRYFCLLLIAVFLIFASLLVSLLITHHLVLFISA